MGVGGSRTVLWYGIPAYGHVYSNLYLARCLTRRGIRVVYYSLPGFREVIEANGCEYRSYPISEGELVLADGSRILRLYRLILEYTQRMLPVLEAEAQREQPCAVIFESLALWGRVMGERLGVPSFSFYSIVAIKGMGDAAFWAYAKGFSGVFLQDVGELRRIGSLRRELRRNWGIDRLGMKEVLMNRGDWNLMGYSRRFQPGGGRFGGSYLFLGPMAVHRRITERNDFVCPEGGVIYISLGTIFNRDEMLLQEIVRQLGRKDGRKEREYSVVLVWDGEKREFPGNFIVRRFVNQGEVMRRASLFVTSGGMNSIHEALYYGVPCLMCPQQGEQLVNARQFERLGFGRILRDLARLRAEMEQAMKLGRGWNEQWRREVTAVRVHKYMGFLEGQMEAGKPMR